VRGIDEENVIPYDEITILQNKILIKKDNSYSLIIDNRITDLEPKDYVVINDILGYLE
jgi:hypothetical protein